MLYVAFFLVWYVALSVRDVFGKVCSLVGREYEEDFEPV